MTSIIEFPLGKKYTRDVQNSPRKRIMMQHKIIRVLSSTSLIAGTLACLPLQVFAYTPNASTAIATEWSAHSEGIILATWTVDDGSSPGSVYIRNGTTKGAGTTWIKMPDRKTAEKTAKKLNKAERKAKKRAEKDDDEFIADENCQPTPLHTC